MTSHSSTEISNFTLNPIGFDNVIQTGQKYGTEYKIKTNTGVYTGNIKLTHDSKAVPDGVCRWIPK